MQRFSLYCLITFVHNYIEYHAKQNISEVVVVYVVVVVVGDFVDVVSREICCRVSMVETSKYDWCFGCHEYHLLNKKSDPCDNLPLDREEK